MCPKCKNKRGAKFFATETDELNIVFKNPHWKCRYCGWLGFVTNKYCLCHKSEKLVFTKNKFYCLKCQRPALTSVEENDLKYLPTTEDLKKETKKQIYLSCPKCNSRLFGSYIKGEKIGEERVPLWCCTNYICIWSGIRTEKKCRRCGNYIVLTKERLDCPYCHKLLVSADDFLEEKEKYKDSLNKI